MRAAAFFSKATLALALASAATHATGTNGCNTGSDDDVNAQG